MPDAHQLYQLQKIDTEITQCTKRLAEIIRSLVESDALKQAKANYSQADSTYKRLKAKMTDLELEVKSLQQKIKQQEDRLYSGKILNPKEAASVQDDIAATKRWLSSREEALLEVMIEVEEAEETLAERDATQKEVQAQWETDQADLLQEQKKTQQRLGQLQENRPKISQFIVSDELKLYDRLRQKKGGLAVAAVDDDTCLSCGFILPMHTIQQAETSTDLAYCDGCGRILYIL